MGFIFNKNTEIQKLKEENDKIRKELDKVLEIQQFTICYLNELKESNDTYKLHFKKIDENMEFPKSS